MGYEGWQGKGVSILIWVSNQRFGISVVSEGRFVTGRRLVSGLHALGFCVLTRAVCGRHLLCRKG